MTIYDMASKSAIAVKTAVLARSGVYNYSYKEILARGINPKVIKDTYREYRPPSLIVNAQDKFRYAVLTKEHPLTINPDNVKDVIEGVVGSNISVVTLDSTTFGEPDVALEGEIAFYTKDAFNYFTSGAKETSAQYEAVTVEVEDNPDYDLMMVEIKNVAGLAITQAGRGGSTVRIYDSSIAPETINTSAAADKDGGRKEIMKKGILSLLGIGPKDDSNISSLVIDSLKGYSGLTDDEKSAKEAEVIDSCAAYLESKEKEILVGTIYDCFAAPEEVLKESESVAKVLDSLQKSCAARDEVYRKEVFDSLQKATVDGEGCGGLGTPSVGKAKDEEEEEDEEDVEKGKIKEKVKEKIKEKEKGKKEDDVKDALIALIDAKIAELKKSLDVQVTDSVKSALGLTESKKSVVDSVDNLAGQDTSFLARSIF